MLRKPAYDWPVITADELRDARLRAGYTSQAALAEALNVSLRTVTAWEQEGGHVSPRGEAKVRALLWPAPGPLASYSNYELLSELGRRLDRIGAHDSASVQDVYEISHGSEQISGDDQVSDRPHSGDGPRAAWGRGPRKLRNRSLDDESKPND